MAKIQIENLSHRFASEIYGIQNINLKVEKGELVVIAGQNGSGKSTLCRHINGLLKPTTGRVKIDDFIVQKNLAKARQKVGMVFQNADSQIVGETVADDIAFGPENLGLDRCDIQERVKHAIKTVGLEGKEDYNPQSLSGGEKRKLAIAGVLAMQSEVLIFDEPFANLDYPGSQLVLKQIVDLHKSGHTILVVTHELEKIIAVATRMILLQNGEIVLEGDPSAILSQVENYGVREPCSSKLGKGIQPWLS